MSSATTCHAEDRQSESAAPAKAAASDTTVHPPYCGLYSLHTAMRALGKDIPFISLLKPEYVGSPLGSSVAELRLAATQHGLSAMPLAQMTCGMLRQATNPIILHVKQAGSTRYDHWVLFMGHDSKGARIYDGDRFALESWSSLNARWDGTGLLISDRAISRLDLSMVAIAEFLFWAGMALIVAVLARTFQLKFFAGSPTNLWTANKRSFGQAVGILTVAILATGAAFAFDGDGYLSDPETLTTLRDAHLAKFLPRLTAEQISNLHKSKDVILVDARWKNDYAKGHIPGAVSLEPNSAIETCRDRLKNVRYDQQIIIYCALDGCSYSGRIADQLSKGGYRNLALFPGGWAEWTRYEAESGMRK